MGASGWMILVLMLLVGAPMLIRLWRRGRARGWRYGAETEESTARDGRRAGITFGVGFGLFGLGFFAIMMGSALVHIVQARWWVQVPCTVLSSGVKTHRSDGEGTDTYSIEIRYRYSFGGREYTGDQYHFMGGSTAGESAKRRVVARYRPQAQAVCWVDPKDPARSVIERGFTADMLYSLVPLGFTGIGVGVLIGIWCWGKRA